MSDRPGRAGRRQVICFVGIGLAGVLAALVFAWWRARPSGKSSDRLLFGARAALQRGQLELAERLASHIDRRDELWARGRLVAGEAAARAGRSAAAIDYYGSIPRDGSEIGVAGAFALAEVFRDIGRLSDAQREYTYVLEHQPANAFAH